MSDERTKGHAVTTYGELAYEAYFFWPDSSHLCQRVGDGYVSRGEFNNFPKRTLNDRPVRVLSDIEVARHFCPSGASVVVHEVPGSYVSQVVAGFAHIDSPASWNDLEHIRDQSAALLARRDASPENEPADSDKAANRRADAAMEKARARVTDEFTALHHARIDGFDVSMREMSMNPRHATRDLGFLRKGEDPPFVVMLQDRTQMKPATARIVAATMTAMANAADAADADRRHQKHLLMRKSQ